MKDLKENLAPNNGSVLDILKQWLLQKGIAFSPQTIRCFELYLKELKEWNKKINLTSIKEDREIIVKHFIDSLTPVEFLPQRGFLADIGSGAGFPGVPIKIVSPHLRVSLIESKRKKAFFLSYLLNKLSLKDIEVLCCRAESLKERCFDVVIGRAVANLERFLRISSFLVRKEGVVVVMKGKDVDIELRDVQKTIEKEHLMLYKRISLRLPLDKGQRTILLFKRQ